MHRAALVLVNNFALGFVNEDPAKFVVDEETHRQTDSIVRTGEDSGPSALVTFESIKAQTLPVERTDTATY